MKKKFKMENVDCAHCAAKMEEGIRKIKGVNEVSLSFMTQKLVIDADDEKFEEIIEQAAKVCAKVDPDCKIIR